MADVAAFVLEPDRPGRIAAPPCFIELVLEPFVAGLVFGLAQSAEGRALVVGQAFQIDDLRTEALQFQQNVRLAAARVAAQHEDGPGARQLAAHEGPVAFVAAFQPVHGEAARFQQPAHAVAAHAAPPAVEQDLALAAAQMAGAGQQGGQMTAHQLQGQMDGAFAPAAGVGRPDLGAFFVARNAATS